MTLKYTGQKQPRAKELLTDYKHVKPYVDERRLLPYQPSEPLIEAVNLTLIIEKRPLLLRGEPGCGKTRLAQMVAFELGLPYFEWHVQSTTKAQDGLYRYDALRRLHDVQMVAKELKPISKRDPSKVADPADVKEYIEYGPLGQAFQSEQLAVVLIDEIDKADIDFPNDLLLALDESRFTVTESGEPVEAKQTPIIFITSNDEKELPDAFLRRCLFFYIDLPQDETVQFEYFKKIVALHYPHHDDAFKIELMTQAVSRFVKLRREMEKTGGSHKKASTSELLDWYLALLADETALDKLMQKELPFAEALLKTRPDLKFRQSATEVKK